MHPSEKKSEVKINEIEPGMKFGHWEVLKFHHKNEHRIKYWLCRCDVCGTERPVRGTSLVSGYSVACSKRCADTLIGQQFGEWTVLKNDKSRPRNYICRCSCGTVKSVFSGSLKQGASKSCGCKKAQDAHVRNRNNAMSHIGEKFGQLTVLECYKKNNRWWYRCQCDCGNTIDVQSNYVLTQHTSSCGCLNSWANREMDSILTKLNIPFKREYRFLDCCDRRPLPFDFAIFNNQDELIGLMELNGAQHYSCSGSGWDTPERLVWQQKHDYLKRKFCEDNRIPFLVIPYQFFNELEKFLTTSDFWEIITKNFND